MLKQSIPECAITQKTLFLSLIYILLTMIVDFYFYWCILIGRCLVLIECLLVTMSSLPKCRLWLFYICFRRRGRRTRLSMDTPTTALSNLPKTKIVSELICIRIRTRIRIWLWLHTKMIPTDHLDIYFLRHFWKNCSTADFFTIIADFLSETFCRAKVANSN